jgi:hypothetical protein
MAASEERIGIRLPKWLKQDVKECAARSGWSFSQQVRYELAERRGRASQPYLPSGPNQEKPTRRRSAGV